MLIPLGNGVFTEIDSEDLPKLDGWKVYLGSDGVYAFARAEQMVAPLARILLGLDKGDPRMADHIDSSRTLDNRRSNLRIVTKFQSQWNTRKKCYNTSGHKGVSWHSRKRRWQSSIVVEGKTIWLGQWKDLQAAIDARAEAARKYHGEYARI